ncbi:MAG TPA: hypothetical protein VHJ78_12735 [Actinomycetota bacterium]|nr:hypothetical protein [Actinomycetota bacterium]
MRGRLLYLGVGLVAGATIVYEVALTRIFSLAYGYHFAFLAMSLGLLGFGISGTLLALRPKWRERVRGTFLGGLGLASAAAFAGGYLLASRIPLDPYRVGWDPLQLPWLAAYLAAFALPFLLTGLVQGIPITSNPGRSGFIYASGLAGSGAGGLAALALLQWVSPPQALLAAAAGAALAAPSLAAGTGGGLPVGSRAVSGAAAVLAGALAGVAVVNPGWIQVRMSEYKPLPQLLNLPDAGLALSASNAEAAIDVVDSASVHSAPGLSPGYGGQLPEQSAAVVDGDTVLPLTRIDRTDPAFFEALPSLAAYRLRPGARALVVQPGGGLEVATALAGGARSVLALESNKLLATLLEDRLASRAGRVFQDPRVELAGTNPRAYLAGKGDRFDVISLALSENRRTVSVGAFSLSETYPLTVEAFRNYLDRLQPDGILVAHRWLQLPPTEEVRAAAGIAEAVAPHGNPGRRIIALRSFSTMLLLAKTEPFSAAEIAAVQDFAGSRQFDLVYYPGIRRSETNRFNVLRNDRYYDAFQGLLSQPERFYERYEYEVSPIRDDRPFFFHFFKWAQTPTVLGLLGRTWQPFGGSGYLLVLGLLAVTSLLAAVLLVVPALAIRRREKGVAGGRATWRPAVYFAMLGLGFLVVEVALVGRFMLLLDHSAGAFTLVLFGLLAFSGVGSALSPRIPWRPALGVLAGLIALYGVVLTPVLQAALTLALPVRIAIAMLLLIPLGTLMGVGFPRGLTWLETERPSWVPMAWGLNGFMSVIGAIVAALVSLSWGYSVVLWLGAAAYLVACLTAGSRPAGKFLSAGYARVGRTPRP